MSLARDRRRGSYQARRLFGLQKPLGDVVPTIQRATVLSFDAVPKLVAAAQAGMRVRVYQYELFVIGLDVVKFQSWDGAAAFTDATGDIGIDAARNRGLPLHVGYSPVGHFQSLVGQHLVLAPVLGTVTTGNVWYAYV